MNEILTQVNSNIQIFYWRVIHRAQFVESDPMFESQIFENLTNLWWMFGWKTRFVELESRSLDIRRAESWLLEVEYLKFCSLDEELSWKVPVIQIQCKANARTLGTPVMQLTNTRRSCNSW